MKNCLAYVWQRRWCRMLIVGAMLCAVPMLHPLFRQLLFGPTIDGVPWCVYEQAVRDRASPRGTMRPWILRMFEKWGLAPTEYELPAGLPGAMKLLSQMADDPDENVRRYVLGRLLLWEKVNKDEVLAVYRAHLDDDDPLCRVICAGRLWHLVGDERVATIALELAGYPDVEIRCSAAYLLGAVGNKHPDSFDRLSTLASDADFHVRCAAIWGMPGFGKRGLPVVAAGLRDSDPVVRQISADVAGQFGKEGRELVPILVAMRGTLTAQEQAKVEKALQQIAPDRFPPVRNVGE